MGTFVFFCLLLLYFAAICVIDMVDSRRRRQDFFVSDRHGLRVTRQRARFVGGRRAWSGHRVEGPEASLVTRGGPVC